MCGGFGGLSQKIGLRQVSSSEMTLKSLLVEVQSQNERKVSSR